MKTLGVRALHIICGIGITLYLVGCATGPDEVLFRSGAPLSGEIGIKWVDSGSLDQVPVLVSGNVPSQPILKLHEQGWAHIRFTVNANGRTENMVLLGSEGEYFGGNTLEALRFWRFRPAMQGGQAVASVGEIRWEFLGRMRTARPELTIASLSE